MLSVDIFSNIRVGASMNLSLVVPAGSLLAKLHCFPKICPAVTHSMLIIRDI